MEQVELVDIRGVKRREEAAIPLEVQLTTSKGQRKMKEMTVMKEGGYSKRGKEKTAQELAKIIRRRGWGEISNNSKRAHKS